MEYVLNFEDLGKEDIQTVGGKNASLGELIKAGIRVPPGFAVTTASYVDFTGTGGIHDEIFATLDRMKTDDIASLNATSEEIQRVISRGQISEAIHASISGAYGALCETCRSDTVPVAVRSSATAEDLPTASFAGQQDTYLWIEGLDRIVEKIQLCWASLFTPRAIDYRIRNNFPHDKVLISVGVQKMVNARAAGVMFSLNPTDGDPSKVVIEGSWGLGETVVSGSVNPDKFVVDKVVMETSERTVSAKHIECVFDPERGGTVDADVDPERQCTCCLDDREVKELVKLAKHIEKHYGRAMDIEWSIDKGMDFPENIFIVQARPETVWSRKKATSVIGKKSGYELLMAQAMKRIKIPS